MRHVILAVLLAACSKGGDTKNQTGDPPPAPDQVKRELAIKGSIAITGAFTATVSLPPGQDMICACFAPDNWVVDATYTDGKDTAVALKISTKQGMQLTSGKLRTDGSLESAGTAGFRGTCQEDRVNNGGVMSIDLDGKLTGKRGEGVTLKGHLDVICHFGL